MRKIVVSLLICAAMMIPAVSSSQENSYGTKWLAKGLYDQGAPLTSACSDVEVYAVTKEAYFSIWDLQNGSYVRVFPIVSIAPADTFYTVPRGTSMHIGLGAKRAYRLYLRTGTTASDSTAISLSWW